MTRNKLNALARASTRLIALPLFALCCAFLVAILPSCGGGTDGSGVRSFGGQVLSENASPLAGATITVAETGDSAVTDEDGNFSISTRLAEGQTSATFVIQAEAVSTSAVLSDLNPSAAQVGVLIVVDRPSNTAQAIALATPTPRPTSTAAPGAPTATPASQASATPTEIPPPGSTETPFPTATPTSTPITPIPTATVTPVVVTPESDECRCDLDLNSYLNANDFQHAINDYAMGTLDFDGNGVTQLADFQAFSDLCTPVINMGGRCLEHA